MNLAPIILFCYNRPFHLHQTLNWLRANMHASDSILYVFCDGPKAGSSNEQLLKINEARTIVDELAVTPSFKEVHVLKREENLGLGISVITGVTEVINIYGKAIVLEDDLETSPLFLDYMNKCLNHYESRKSVFSISATSRPNHDRFFPKDYQYDVYVSLTHRPTGWATWKDRWEQVDWDASNYNSIRLDQSMIKAFNRLGDDYFSALSYQQENKQNVWSIRFALAHFENHAVSICPIVSYINHIGWDREATNAISGGNRWEHNFLASKKDIKLLDILYENADIINSWYSFSISRRRSLFCRIINRFAAKYLKRDEFILKGKIYD